MSEESKVSTSPELVKSELDLSDPAQLRAAYHSPVVSYGREAASAEGASHAATITYTERVETFKAALAEGPSRGYQGVQRLYVDALHRAQETQVKADWDSYYALRARLRNLFAAKLGLDFVTWAAHRRARVAIERAYGQPGAFDHYSYVAFLNYSPARIIVSQPYQESTERHRELAERYRYHFIEANEWGFYYPGKAACSVFVLDTPTATKIRKQLLTKISFGAGVTFAEGVASDSEGVNP